MTFSRSHRFHARKKLESSHILITYTLKLHYPLPIRILPVQQQQNPITRTEAWYPQTYATRLHKPTPPKFIGMCNWCDLKPNYTVEQGIVRMSLELSNLPAWAQILLLRSRCILKPVNVLKILREAFRKHWRVWGQSLTECRYWLCYDWERTEDPS